MGQAVRREADKANGGMIRAGSLRRRRPPRYSHSFGAADGGSPAPELVDLNAASEEVLMTLPGVDRRTARAIVSHRRTIGRFRRIEDVALVPGMGADRLARLRPEARVRRLDAAPPPPLPLDLNAATVFELQRPGGFDQRTAAAIVERRRRKGPFRRLDDLLKVDGVDRARLGEARARLTVDGRPPAPPPPPTQPVRTPGAPRKAPAGLAADAAGDVFDLLSAYSPRPAPADPFGRRRRGRPALRIAVWNLLDFGAEKASNPGVREVLCRTLLENGISILAARDVADEEALRTICDDLNAPTLRRVAEWKANSRKWKHRLLRGMRCGFIYEASGGDLRIELEDEADPTADEDPARDVAVASFVVNRGRIDILNARFSNADPDPPAKELRRTVDRLSADSRNTIIIVGDFYSSELIEDLASDYKLAIQPEAVFLEDVPNPDHRGGCILAVGKDDECYAGHSGVIQTGLHHLAIPNGWTWGGSISPYCPLWADFFVNDYNHNSI